MYVTQRESGDVQSVSLTDSHHVCERPHQMLTAHTKSTIVRRHKAPRSHVALVVTCNARAAIMLLTTTRCKSYTIIEQINISSNSFHMSNDILFSLELAGNGRLGYCLLVERS